MHCSSGRRPRCAPTRCLCVAIPTGASTPRSSSRWWAPTPPTCSPTPPSRGSTMALACSTYTKTALHTANTYTLHHACTQPIHCTHCLNAAYTGVLRLKDLPALMSEARAGAEARDDEVSFVLGSVAHTRNGDMLTDDDVSDAVSIDLSTRGGELTRAELLPALARIQLDDRDVGTAPGTVEELSDGDDSDEADGLRSISNCPCSQQPTCPSTLRHSRSLRACSAPPSGPWRRAPAAWMPKRGCCSILFPTQTVDFTAFDRPGPELPNDCWTAAAPGEGAAPGVASGDSLPGKTQNGSRRKGTPPTGGICTLQ